MIPREVLTAYCGTDRVRIQPLGAGNINQTFLIETAAQRFVLQRISDTVFPQPEKVIDNFTKVATHIASRQGTKGLLRVAELVPTLAGASFWRDHLGGYWRGQSWLSHQPVQPRGKAGWGSLGRCLAIFHEQVADLQISELADPLPGFHYLPGYVADFDQLLASGQACWEDLQPLHQRTIDRYRGRAELLEQAASSGLIARQVVHGDPKLENFLFGQHGQADALIDLDTTGPGLLHYDLGDMLRSSCNLGGEEGDVDEEVKFALDRCLWILGGYLAVAGKRLDGQARDLLVDSIALVSFELGLRFLTDHLRGDSYFTTSWRGQNLARSRRLFVFVTRVEEAAGEIRRGLAGLP